MKNTLPVLALCALLAACGGGEDGGPIGTVTITSPTEGSVVDGPAVTVQLSVSGFELRPAGDLTVGTGHHHLYLDTDVTDPREPVPTLPQSVIHMGDASSEYTFPNVAPGEHRLIAVVADGVHVPLQPWVVDTVHFTVR
jgi:hypothetical protein